MLETLREYAAERLAERADATEIRTRHAEHFVALAEDSEAGLDGPDWVALATPPGRRNRQLPRGVCLAGGPTARGTRAGARQRAAAILATRRARPRDPRLAHRGTLARRRHDTARDPRPRTAGILARRTAGLRSVLRCWTPNRPSETQTPRSSSTASSAIRPASPRASSRSATGKSVSGGTGRQAP